MWTTLRELEDETELIIGSSSTGPGEKSMGADDALPTLEHVSPGASPP